MATIADSTRISPPLVAAAGQTDFAVPFPYTPQDGISGLLGLRLRAGVVAILTMADWSIPATAADSFTLRLNVAALDGDEYVFYGRQPGSRSRDNTLTAQVRADVLLADLLQLYTYVQELRRDTERALTVSPFGGSLGAFAGQLVFVDTDGFAKPCGFTVAELLAAALGIPNVVAAAADDAAAAAAGVPVRGIYFNGSVVQVRLA